MLLATPDHTKKLPAVCDELRYEIQTHMSKAEWHPRDPPHALDIIAPTGPYFASQPVENTTNPHPKAFGSSALLRFLSQHDVQESRPFG
jgi:hypothetical protein